MNALAPASVIALHGWLDGYFANNGNHPEPKLNSGFAQTLTEGTVTYEYRPNGCWILKVEGRRDHSTGPVFAGGHDQTLAITNAVVVF